MSRTPRYLEEIVAASSARPIRPAPRPTSPPPGFAAALASRAGRAVIAEIKVASPSRGPLLGGRNPADLARIYAKAGAAAISVVTEPSCFLGSIELLGLVRESTELPVIRKDFLTRLEQVDESISWGAAAVLLIARILEGSLLAALLHRCADAGLDALVEIHDTDDLEKAASAGARILGVNNRDLETFQVDLGVSAALAPSLGEGAIKVAESGIRSAQDVVRLRALGYDAFLVGESLLTAPDPGALLRGLVDA